MTEETDLVTKYLSLDPSGTYFKEANITWSVQLDEPVAIEFVNKLPFERMLGNNQSVPELNQTYFPLQDVVEAFHAACCIGTTFAMTGAAGTGKSEFIEYMAAILNRPFFVADIHEDYRPETLFGETKLDTSGNLVWKDGPVAEAMKNKGSFFLLDEANFANPAILACMHRVLTGKDLFLHDKAGKSEEVKISKALGVIFCMSCNALNNSDEASLYADTKDMNVAFLDRWHVICETSYPNKTTEISIIKKKLKASVNPKLLARLEQIDNLDTKIDVIVTAAIAIRSAITSGDLPIAFSLRRTEMLAKLLCHFNGDLTKTIHLGVLSREDRNNAKVIEDILFTKCPSTMYTRKFRSNGEFA